MSRSPQALFDHVVELTELYLRDEISADQLAELESLVRKDRQAADAMRTVLKQAGMMRVVFTEQRTFASRIGETNRDEYLALLQTLQPTEEPELVHLVAQVNTTRPLWQQWPVVIPSGIAALLAIAVTLIVTLSGPAPTPNTPNHFAQPPQGPTTTTTTQPVATITAEHDAVWASPQAEGATAPGSPLRAGQTLTLTAGFAEITTAQGAIAIIEAPATIELLDNNNALHLHTGKLVGICETESSQGFLVRTPHMDVTDLGTRFGVDASNSGTTEVHVYEGIVEVDHASASSTAPAKPQRLIAGQALQATGDTDDFVVIPTDPTRFAAIMPTRIELPGTGQGLALSDTDPNWRVTAIDGKPLETPGVMTVRDAHERINPPFLPNDPQTSQWLIIDTRLGQSGTGPVTFTCQSRFEIPPGVDASAARLIVSFDADDSVTAVRINGQAVAVPENEFVDDSRDLHAMTIRRHMIAGQNTIEFDVMDRRSLGRATSGLRVRLSLQPD